jgi:hypothetical protein
MDLLTAVNSILHSLGERPVNSLTSASPTLAVVIPELKLQLTVLLTHGYWFNRFRTILYPDQAGTYYLPDGTLSFVADTAPVVTRGRKLYNTATLTYTISDVSISGVITQTLDFDDLPECAQQLVMYRSCVQAYAKDIGMEQVVQLWSQNAREAQLQVETEHLRNMKYSTAKSPKARRLQRALRGI